MGCNGPAVFAGLFTNADTGETFEVYLEEDISTTRVRFGDTPFGPDGTFSGTDVTVEDDYFPVASSSGAWGGRFSNIPDPAGDPRLVAGTGGGRGETAGGSSVVFVGHYFAGTE